MRRSFAVRLAVAFAAVGLAAAAVTALLVNVVFGARFTGYLEERQGERLSHLVGALAEAYLETDSWDPQALQRLASTLLMDGGTLAVEGADGSLLWESQADPMAEAHRQMMGAGPLGEAQRVPIDVEGALVGTAVVRVPQTGVLPQDVAFRASVNRMILAGAVAAGVAALLLGLLLARRTTAPVRALTQAARAVASGQRSTRVTEARSDEFGAMAAAFNRMTATVEEEDRLRRAFAADVAHELRTPLMILRGEIEALEDGLVDPTPQALASLRDETLRLGRLVDDLETLAHADAAGFSLDRRTADLAVVVAEAAEEQAPGFIARSILLETTLAPDLVAVIDPIRIKQVVTNLLSNAAKFTPDQGSVRLSAKHDGTHALVTVWNSGSRISAEDLPRVFDRFYRGSRPHVGGSGIGLTVARDLAEAHGGGIEVASSAEHGTTFRLRLPLGDGPTDTRTASFAPAEP